MHKNTDSYQSPTVTAIRYRQRARSAQLTGADSPVHLATDSIGLRTPVGALAAEDEARIVALTQTDFRLAAELDELRSTVGQHEAASVEWRQWSERTAARLSALEAAPAPTGYVFKVTEEGIWALLIGLSGVLATAAVNLDTVTDWRGWAVGLALGLLRFAAGWFLSLRKGQPGAEAAPLEEGAPAQATP